LILDLVGFLADDQHIIHVDQLPDQQTNIALIFVFGVINVLEDRP
jgi:hypothetical protein